MRNDRANFASYGLLYSVRRFCASLFLLTVTSSSVVAQLDTDPTNDEQVNGDDLGLLPGFAISNQAALAASGNDVDYFTVQLSEDDVVFGMVTPITSLPSTFEVPDTMASVVGFGSRATFSDDDFADELPFDGEMHGSMFRFQAPLPSTYYIGITGYQDWEFDGALTGMTHSEVGDYMLTAAVVTPSVMGGSFTETDPANNTIAGADALPSSSRAHVSVLELLEDDVDFFKLTLTAGQVLSAMTAPLDDLQITFEVPDTMIGLFNATGTLLVTNDDAGDEGFSDLEPELGSDSPTPIDGIFGSGLRALIPADGVYYVGVTGFEDDNFTGNHAEQGLYALLIGLTGQDDNSLPGDFNADGTVDAADYVVWRKNVGGQFDESDYLDWRTNFGRSNAAGSSSLAAIPEPSTFTTLLPCIALIAIVLRKKSI
jgi:hypothetical protein